MLDAIRKFRDLKQNDMKKLAFLPLVMLLYIGSISAQDIWFAIGAKASYGSSFLWNKNILDDGRYNHEFTAANGFGARLGIGIGYNHAFNFEAMLHNNKQDFNYKVSNILTGQDETFNSSVEWKTIDLYLLYRLNSSKVYLELGPAYTMLRDINQVDDNPLFSNDTDVTNFYRDSYLSGVFGFGGYLVGNETFSLNLGFRIMYAFSDFITEEGQENGLIYKSFPAPLRENNYDNYTGTHPLTFEASLELEFGLGGFAKTSCSKRMHFFWSGNR